jgi:hypothetical protein
MEVTMSEQLKNKIVNPTAHFDKPKDVVQDDALSHQEKKKAINTWEQDERQLLTASNEGMPGSDEANERRKPIVSMRLSKRKIRSAKSQSTSHLIKR